MASESDDSFVWTNTSSDSEMAIENGKDESDSDFKIKKELLNDIEKQIEKQPKKRKLTEDTVNVHSEQKKLKQIKSEPESDFERPRKKKKVRNDSEISKSNIQDTIDDIDNYLNIRVKQEQESIVENSDVKPKKKKKHKKELDLQDPDILESQMSSIEDDNTKVVNDSQDQSNQVDDYLNYRIKLEQESFVEPHENKVKKKKSKKSLDGNKTESNHSEKHNKIKTDSNIENSSTDISDVKEEHENPKKRSKKLKNKDKQRECSIESEGIEKSTSKKRKSESLHKEDLHHENESIENTLEDYNDQSEDSNVHEKEKSELATEEKQESGNKRLSRPSLGSSDGEHPKANRSFSERLRFEEDNSADFESVNDEKMQNWPKQIKQYAKINKHITPTSPKIHAKHTISDDDEVWIIKCPNEFDIKDFEDINLTLDNKCKIKLNGQTYDGAIDVSIQRVPILSFDKSKQKSFIKNVSIMGLTKFRKRLPKVHIPDQGTVINNYANFIPLPETKCRHPLLGVNYKKALKIPPSIAERLNGTIEEPSLSESVKKKKKKHKKEKSEIEGDTEMEPTADQSIKSKKKRKRKHSDEVDAPPSKPKRIKQDPDSAEAWESEQAIQNNLFGFE